MTIYLILTLAFNIHCPKSYQVHVCSQRGDEISFTLSEPKALKALEGGSRVFTIKIPGVFERISNEGNVYFSTIVQKPGRPINFPLVFSELHREASTTYKTTETEVKVE